MRIPIIDIEFNIHEEIEEVFMHRFFFVMGRNLVAIFIPLYLYDLGFSVPVIIFFFLVFYAVYFVASMPLAKLASVIGYRKISMLSTPWILVFFFLLRSMEIGPASYLYLLALIGGLGFNMYWIGMNSELSSDSHEGRRGQETGIFFSLSSAAGILSPFLGGLVISLLGFKALFTLTILLIAVSFVPFFFSKEHYSGMDISPGAIFNRDHLQDFFLFFFKGIVNLGGKVVWPLYLALVITGSLNIGGAGSLRALGATIFGLVLGKQVDKGNANKVLVYGGLVLAVTWVLMSSVTTPLQAFVISLVNGLFSLALNVPVVSGVLKKARNEDILEYFAFREIALSAGRMTFLGTLAFFFVYLSQTSWFILGFGLLALSTVGSVILGKQYGDNLSSNKVL